MWAIPVPSFQRENNRPLGHGAIARLHQFREKGCVALDDLRRTPKLRPALVHVVHDKNEGARILRKISGGDVLPITAVIGESQRLIVECAKGGPPRC